MPICDLGDIALHYREEGDPKGAPVVFSHGLGLDLRLWDEIIPRLPQHLRLIRYDLRGHGGSSVPPPPYSMGTMVRDAERLLEALGVRDCVFIGLSLGGMIAQGLAVKRLDLVRGLVLSNTATKIATPEIWEARMAQIRQGGLEAVAEAAMERWFSRAFRRAGGHLPWRERFLASPEPGYLGGCAAIAGTDFYTPTASLTLPTLVIAGSEDGATPPDLMRETAALIAGAEFQLIRGVGHLPCVENPAGYAALLNGFLTRIAHDAAPEPSCGCGCAHHGHGH